MLKKNEVINSNSWLYRGLVSFFAALAAALTVCLIIRLLPYDEDVEKYRGVLLQSVIPYCRPEPWEIIQYVAAVFVFPSVFLLCLYRLRKRTAVKDERREKLTTAVLLTAAFAMPLPLTVSYRMSWLVHFSGLAAAVPFALLTGWLCIRRRDSRQTAEKAVFFAVMVCVTVFAFLRISRLNFMMQEREYNYFHFYAWWYPVYRVDSGQCIGVDFENIYGFYPYFVVPVLRLLGGVGQETVPVFISMLLCIVSSGYYIFCYRFINNKLLAALTATVCSLAGPFSALGDTIYLQYDPTRSLFPAVVLILLTVHSLLKKKSRRILFAVLCCPVMAAGICWNVESGIVASVFMAAYLFWSAVRERGLFTRHTVAAALRAVLFVIVSAVLFVAAVEAVTYSLSGQLIGREEILFGITAFAGTGYYMLPMNYIGLWVMAVMIFLAGLAVSLYCAVREEKAERADMTGLFSASVMGTGAFTYFVGRSHPEVIMHILPECVLVCALLAEYMLNMIPAERTERSKGKTGAAVCGAGALMCLVFVLYCSNVGYDVMKTNLSRGYSESNFSADTSENTLSRDAAAIKEWADAENGGEIPAMLVFYSVYYDELLGRRAEENVSDMIDWFYRDNARSYLDYIKEHPGQPFVLSWSAVSVLEEEFGEEYTGIIEDYRLEMSIEVPENKWADLYIYAPLQRQET